MTFRFLYRLTKSQMLTITCKRLKIGKRREITFGIVLIYLPMLPKWLFWHSFWIEIKTEELLSNLQLESLCAQCLQAEIAGKSVTEMLKF